ncbi:disease resistance protein RPS6-like isoform X2 [Neltuma alba]|uniref:disease resistance protein RPS6-like isoform X2 n=1 Tax=Neltuma alba TaxID=207710 RepID=UPI0010A4C4D1|nr:disease resistance protein RPS6-like isoform X2 [Prosopis alba]
MAIQVVASSSSSSSSSPPSFTNGTKYRYDVFLSFRGEDTRQTFTVPLYDALRCNGINAFIDDKKLGKGEEISPTLLKAIERSRISIIVFSRNYATSTWCLEELAHIVWCKKEKNQLVMPIFYKVNPLDVQYQRNSFEEAMADLEHRFHGNLKKVQKWRSALSEAASLSSTWLFDDGEIVRQEAPSDLGKRSRLWYYEDVLKVLHENLGGNNIEGIILDPPQEEEVKCSDLAFEKMNNLRIIIIRNTRFLTCPKYLPNSLILLDWQGYPSVNLPPDFSPPKLVCLKICGSPFSLEHSFENFEYLTYLDFSKCEFITEVPDMSQFQNLKTLSFRECHNLVKVHDSVGSLCKLVELNVSKCIKLASFPQEIKMPSLQVLNFNNCKSLDYFPHIVGNMDPLMYVYAEGSAINKLPSSIGNLPKLDILSLRSCENLRELPNSLLTLHNLGVLLLGGLKPHGRKSLKKLMQESQPPTISCTNIDRLDLHNCGLLDEDLHLTLKCFQNMRDLNLSGNDFVSLPECIKDCVHLWKLEVSDCKRLRDVPELPSSLGDITAENCTSLTTESSGHLWSQAIKCNRMAIWMPATTYPGWFDHCCKGDTLSFYVRGKNFPRVVVAFETGKANRSERYSFYVFMSINGSQKMPWMQSDFPIEVEGGRVLVSYGKQGHMLFSDLLGEFSEEELEGLNKSLQLDWNDVEIQVTSRTDDIAIVNCGVYVDKKQTNMGNVQFKSPFPSRASRKRKAMASHPNEPPKKRLRKFNNAVKDKES